MRLIGNDSIPVSILREDDVLLGCRRLQREGEINNRIHMALALFWVTFS
jgi:hypothetical protein